MTWWCFSKFCWLTQPKQNKQTKQGPEEWTWRQKPYVSNRASEIDLLDKWELFVTIKNFFLVSVVYSHLQPWEDVHLA